MYGTTECSEKVEWWEAYIGKSLDALRRFSYFVVRSPSREEAVLFASKADEAEMASTGRLRPRFSPLRRRDTLSRKWMLILSAALVALGFAFVTIGDWKAATQVNLQMTSSGNKPVWTPADAPVQAVDLGQGLPSENDTSSFGTTREDMPPQSLGGSMERTETDAVPAFDALSAASTEVSGQSIGTVASSTLGEAAVVVEGTEGLPVEAMTKAPDATAPARAESRTEPAAVKPPGPTGTPVDAVDTAVPAFTATTASSSEAAVVQGASSGNVEGDAPGLSGAEVSATERREDVATVPPSTWSETEPGHATTPGQPAAAEETFGTAGERTTQSQSPASVGAAASGSLSENAHEPIPSVEETYAIREKIREGTATSVVRTEYFDEPLEAWLHRNETTSFKIVISHAVADYVEKRVAFVVYDAKLKGDTAEERIFPLPPDSKCLFPDGSSSDLQMYKTAERLYRTTSIWACDLTDNSAEAVQVGLHATTRTPETNTASFSNVTGNNHFHLPKMDPIGDVVSCMKHVYNMTNSLPHMLEYMRHYKSLNVDHFIIYVEGGEVDTDLLESLPSYVTLVRVPKSLRLQSVGPQHRNAMLQIFLTNDCVWRTKHRTNWTMVQFDLDELIIGTRDLKAYLANVTDSVKSVYVPHRVVKQPVGDFVVTNDLMVSKSRMPTWGKTIVRPENVNVMWVHRPTSENVTTQSIPRELSLAHFRNGHADMYNTSEWVRLSELYPEASLRSG